jgi:phosphoribosylglycinamide formyltransferase-1
LKIAKHGAGSNVYLVRFHYVSPSEKEDSGVKRGAAPSGERKPSGGRQRARVMRILAGLPEAKGVVQGDHLRLEVRGKRFGYFLADHHRDGRIAISCKSSPDVRDAVQQLAPQHLHIPKYVGNKGWIGVWLDVAKLDWSVVELALREAYLLTAPKKLSSQL